MTFEMLNDSVILVELSLEEMKKYHITYETLDCDSQFTQSAIQSILNIIKASDKFNMSDKILVEALPVYDGGCFFIFTFTQKKKVRYKMKRYNDYTVFKTDNLDNLLDFVSALKKQYRKNLEYDIYKLDKSFYMQIPENSPKLNAVMGEFGQISDVIPEKIREFGDKVGLIII